MAEYAITYAVLLDDKELAEDLCKNGANLNITDYWNNNKSPLEIAVEYGRAEIVSILSNHGARLPANVSGNIPSSNFYTNPLTFFWTLKERAYNRQVDFDAVSQAITSCGFSASSGTDV